MEQGMLVQPMPQNCKEEAQPYPFSIIGCRSTCLNAGRISGELSGV